MNDLRKLSRILLIGLGIYLLINIIIPILSSIPNLINSPVQGIFYETIISYMYYAALMITIIFFLIKMADFWADKIVGINKPPQENEKIFWIPVAFRLSAVLIGLYWIYEFLPIVLSDAVRFIFFRKEYGLTLSDYLNVKYFVSVAVQISLLIYLLCGAPHFMRWHTKKILEQNKNDAKSTEVKALSSQS